MEKLLIMAYMGTGKTELEKRYENVVDFDFQDYKYIYDESIKHLPLEQRKGNVNLRTENPNYPDNFISEALQLLNEGKIVVSPFIEHVFESYNSAKFKERAQGVKIILVCPPADIFEEYIERFRRRGNGEEFIERRVKEFPRLANLFKNANGYDKIIMKPGQYLSSALQEYGINLTPKSPQLNFRR